MERDDLGQSCYIGAVFTQKTDQHLDFRSSSFQLVQGKHLSDKYFRGQILIHQELRRTNKGRRLLDSSSFLRRDTLPKSKTLKCWLFRRNRYHTGMTSDLSENQVYLLVWLSFLVSVSKKYPVTFGCQKILRKSMPLEASQSLDLDWQPSCLVEDRKALYTRCLIALTESLDTGSDPRNRGPLTHWRARDDLCDSSSWSGAGILTSGDPSLSHQVMVSHVS